MESGVRYERSHFHRTAMAMLDEGSRRQLGELPYLELSKHLKIKKSA
jgi:hypothetical protein